MKKKILIRMLCFLNFICSVALAQDSLTLSVFNYYKADKVIQKKYNVVIDSIEARRSRFSKCLKEHKLSGKNIDNFYYDWSNEIRFINQQLKTETNLLIIDLLYFSYLDLGYGTYGLKLDSSIVTSALKSISPKSPLWTLEPSLMEIAIRYSNNYELYKNYIISAMNENFNPDVRNYAKLNLSPYRKIMTGKQVPEFSFHLMNDSLKNISRQTFNGKYLLIDFWATWCVPCIEEMPRLHKIYKQYHDKGLDILSISLDEELNVIQKFQLNKWTMPWYNVQATKSNEAKKLFEVIGIPYPILINTNGKIIATGIELRGKYLEETLAKIKFEQ
jgi:thiol-disulfide isomerase/thioredoxin